MSEQRDKMKAMADRMSAAVRSYVTRALDGRIGDLEARVKALEARPVMNYRGVWNPDETYARGDLVTHDGSMFFCWEQKTCGAKPAQTDAWQLCVKRGKDAR